MRSRLLAWFVLILAPAIGAPSLLAQRIETLTAFDQAQADPDLPWLIELHMPDAGSQNSGGWENLDAYIDRVQQELADEMGWRNLNDIVRYDSIPMMARSLDRTEAERLLRSDKVTGLYRNGWRESFLSQSTQMVGSRTLNAIGQKGRGQVVAVIDNGVDDTHAFLQGKVLDGACFSHFRNCPGGARRATGATAGRPTLNHDHGTHVAGIIAGAGSGRIGVAPDTQLLAVQVFSSAQGRTGATDADILAALDWVYQQRTRHPIAAVNLSLGGGDFRDYCDAGSPYTAIFRLLRQAGIVAVAASGNDQNTRGVATPACISYVLSVGATDKQGQISPFSNSWPRLSFVAPGSEIESAGLGHGFVSKSGTSMAAPHVAGAIAVLRAARPEASAEQIVRSLTEGGRPHRDPRNGVQSVQIDLEKSLRRLPQSGQAEPAPARRPETPAPTPLPPSPTRPYTPAPVPPPARPVPQPDARLPQCEENVDGITVTRQPPCRQGA